MDINGSVGDGPIVGATVEIYNHSGKLLSSVMSDVAASYAFNIKAKGHDYPLLLKVSGGTDLVTGNVPDFQLLSVAMSPSERSVNINPFSTLVVKMAQSMSGGVDAANVSASKAIVTGSFAFGLDPSVVSDPITSTDIRIECRQYCKGQRGAGRNGAPYPRCAADRRHSRFG